MIRDEVTASEVLQRYAAGQRRFVALELADRSDFHEVLLEGAAFDSCILSDIDFRDANLRGVVFKDCNLKGSDFRNADLQNAVFDGSAIESAFFEGALVDGADCSKAYYHGYQLGNQRPDDWGGEVDRRHLPISRRITSAASPAQGDGYQAGPGS